MRSFKFLCASACVFAFACGGSETSNPGDGTGDTGVGVGETSIGNDAGDETLVTPVDTGVDPQDTGTAVQDSGTVVQDTGVEPTDTGPLDYGAPSGTFPAFTPAVGGVVSGGGLTLAAPQIVSIKWTGDQNEADINAFGDLIGGTNYWNAAVSEYGVGSATSGAANHVAVKTPVPSSINDQQIQDLIKTSLADTTLSWPQPNANTIYVVYVPFGTTVDFGGQSACSVGVGGYHDSFSYAGQKVTYGVVTPCRLFGPSLITSRTAFASHEIAEASTDPNPGQAFQGFDDGSLNWEYLFDFQDEVGDACEYFDDSFFTDKEGTFNYAVQRIWSNAAILAGHNPCQPATTGAYFSVTTLTPFPDTVVADLSSLGGSTHQKTKGFNVKVGTSITIPLGFYSDAAMNAWPISAREGSPFAFGDIAQSAKNLTVSVDHTSGQNGEKTYLTVTAKSIPSAKAQIVTITSSGLGTTHYYPIMIGVTP